jgi:hypothetical protein
MAEREALVRTLRFDKQPKAAQDAATQWRRPAGVRSTATNQSRPDHRVQSCLSKSAGFIYMAEKEALVRTVRFDKQPQAAQDAEA